MNHRLSVKRHYAPQFVKYFILKENKAEKRFAKKNLSVFNLSSKIRAHIVNWWGMLSLLVSDLDRLESAVKISFSLSYVVKNRNEGRFYTVGSGSECS